MYYYIASLSYIYIHIYVYTLDIIYIYKYNIMIIRGGKEALHPRCTTNKALRFSPKNS